MFDNGDENIWRTLEKVKAIKSNVTEIRKAYELSGREVEKEILISIRKNYTA